MKIKVKRNSANDPKNPRIFQSNAAFKKKKKQTKINGKTVSNRKKLKSNKSVKKNLITIKGLKKRIKTEKQYKKNCNHNLT